MSLIGRSEARPFDIGQDVSLGASDDTGKGGTSFGHVVGYEGSIVLVRWTWVNGRPYPRGGVSTGVSPGKLRAIGRGYANARSS